MTTSVLFVCMGNICRSPALMATLRHMAALKKLDLHVDSCGMGWSHLGQRPDPRSFEAAKKRGILIDHKAQQFDDAFFGAYDLILAVDEPIVEQLKLRGPQYVKKIKLATAYSRKYKDQEIPDPYYMSKNGFDDCMDIIVDSCEGLLRHLASK